ncbi:MAG: chemotaxis protein CheB [Gammaproteobacteria bacterium]
MARHDIIVIGCSAGGVEPLIELVRDLPADLPAAIFITHHFPATSVSILPAILSRAGPLPAYHPNDGEPVVNGHIYVARPYFHLLVQAEGIAVTRGPKENGHRLAIDPLFRTAARTHGSRVIAVLLSGMLDDGTAGMIQVKKQGGVTIVQDPGEALFAQMPQSAITNADIDYVRPIAGIASLLIDLVSQVVPQADTRPGETIMSSDEQKPDRAEVGTRGRARHEMPGPPTAFTCPSGVRRGLVGISGAQAAELPLPHRPCLYAGQSPIEQGGVSRGGAMVGVTRHRRAYSINAPPHRPGTRTRFTIHQ